MQIDYEKLKFKSGLEVHQQLDTRKLFCNCPSVLRTDEPDFEVERKLHAVAGESGEIDVAAQYQAGLEKVFVYQGHKENSCLVELDEEPPHEINKEALKIAVQVALLLNCKIIPVAQIMRKTVIDGSNTSGFQRTVLVARDGYVETSQGRVGIDTICLEEDSARKVKTQDNKIYWSLDRLGIPLIEIATAPDIKNAEMTKESALKIGNILRSCKVKRGIGTIRQDVNISIRDEERIEMKGVQDMKMFLKIVENEVLRQKELSDKGKPTAAEVRNALPNGKSEFLRPMPGADRMYPETDLGLLKISRNFINDCKKDLPKLRSEVQEELKKKGLNEEMIKLLLKQNRVGEFKSLLHVLNQPSLVAKSMLIYQTELAKKFGKVAGDVTKISERINNSLEPLLDAVKKHQLQMNQVKEAMSRVAQGIKIPEAIKIEKKDVGEIEEFVLRIIKEKPGLNANAYMGLVMKEFGGKVSGKEVRGIINKLVEGKRG